MEQGQLNWIANFIWGIADDVLRDLYVRGKYRDVILPMTVLRRLDAVLEPSKQAVLDMKASLDKAGIPNQDQALRQAAGQAFYNTSRFTLRDLKARSHAKVVHRSAKREGGPQRLDTRSLVQTANSFAVCKSVRVPLLRPRRPFGLRETVRTSVPVLSRSIRELFRSLARAA
jgi:type I restriction-modification system DNA methylase subunit